MGHLLGADRREWAGEVLLASGFVKSPLMDAVKFEYLLVMERRWPEAQLQFRQGTRYTGCAVEDAPIVIGGRHSSVRVPGATVSRQQARIYRADGRVWIEDLGGDGVWVNGEKVERAQLNSRDKLLVGSLELQFWEGQPLSQPAARVICSSAAEPSASARSSSRT